MIYDSRLITYKEIDCYKLGLTEPRKGKKHDQITKNPAMQKTN